MWNTIGLLLIGFSSLVNLMEFIFIIHEFYHKYKKNDKKHGKTMLIRIVRHKRVARQATRNIKPIPTIEMDAKDIHQL